MRTPLVAGNWKMHNTAAETRALISEMLPALDALDGVEKVVCPPATSLAAAASLLRGSSIGLGAQNMHWEEKGAFTGELSPSMVAEFCRYVILGHSERRKYFGETDETVNRKLRSAISHALVPIVCIGETLEENEAGKTGEVLARQIREGFRGISPADAPGIVVAYEPIWAIGTGRAATGEDANRIVAETIRPALSSLFGEAAQRIRVLYGGSVKPANAAEFFSQEEIDGALVGGASLRAADFIEITRQALP